MERPLVPVSFDEASTVLAANPETRRLITELWRTGRKNGIQEQPEPEPGPREALPYWQYPTLTALEAAACHQ